VGGGGEFRYITERKVRKRRKKRERDRNYGSSSEELAGGHEKEETTIK